MADSGDKLSPGAGQENGKVAKAVGPTSPGAPGTGIAE